MKRKRDGDGAENSEEADQQPNSTHNAEEAPQADQQPHSRDEQEESEVGEDKQSKMVGFLIHSVYDFTLQSGFCLCSKITYSYMK
mmetsp:Transcript_41691/g.69456  ORF Transcript_41691/g.69456 Transcript_41691/m.69456 type:complete len:85 (-) Transcript_41691:5737-5991(-)